MPFYDLRLYKRTTSEKPLYHMVDAYHLEAANAEHAKEMAKDTKIPKWDDSDYAVLYGPGGEELWRIDH